MGGAGCLRRFGGPHPMGEKQNQPFQLSFNASLKVDFQGSRVTSDGGLILVRELDERLGLEKLIAEQLSDSRQGLNKHPVINQWSGTRAFCIKRPVGKRRDGWWRRWSSTSGNYSRESALSSRI